MFREIQVISLPVLLGAALAVYLACSIPLLVSLIQGGPSFATMILLFVPAPIVLFLLSLHLRIDVAEGSVTAQFWPLRPLRIDRAEIRKAEEVACGPLAALRARFIRRGSAARFYGIRGHRAVRLELASGEILYLRTQMPADLACAIRQGMGMPGNPAENHPALAVVWT